MKKQNTSLENIAGGPLPIKEDGTFDLTNIDLCLVNEPIKKQDIIIEIKYLPKEDRYGFAIYKESK